MKLLFNGRDLAGFIIWLAETREMDPRGVFSVTHGLLRLSGAGLGHLRTREPYRNYRLVVEFRWGQRIGQARDSGLYFEAEDLNENAGWIRLPCGGSEIFFRRIELHPASPVPR